jgi:hypothetical protein
VDHPALQILDAPVHALWERRVVRGVAVDHDQGLAKAAEAIQDGGVLPVARKPDFVDSVQMRRDPGEQRIQSVSSLRVADHAQPEHSP